MRSTTKKLKPVNIRRQFREEDKREHNHKNRDASPLRYIIRASKIPPMLREPSVPVDFGFTYESPQDNVSEAQGHIYNLISTFSKNQKTLKEQVIEDASKLELKKQTLENEAKQIDHDLINLKKELDALEKQLENFTKHHSIPLPKAPISNDRKNAITFLKNLRIRHFLPIFSQGLKQLKENLNEKKLRLEVKKSIFPNKIKNLDKEMCDLIQQHNLSLENLKIQYIKDLDILREKLNEAEKHYATTIKDDTTTTNPSTTHHQSSLDAKHQTATTQGVTTSVGASVPHSGSTAPVLAEVAGRLFFNSDSNQSLKKSTPVTLHTAPRL